MPLNQSETYNQSKSEDNDPSKSLLLAQAAERCGAYSTAIKHYDEYRQQRNRFADSINISIERCIKHAKISSHPSYANPIASIIIPCHNSERHIEECVTSVLNQTATRIEIILVDDGSTDKTNQILHKFRGRDARIRLIVNGQPSGSAGTPRNQALTISQGQFIGFVDSDDKVKPEYFERMLIQAIARNADLVSNAGFINVNADGTHEERTYKENDQIKYQHDKLSSNHLSSMIWDKIYTKTLLLDNNIWLGTYPAAVDVPFILKAYYYCQNPIYVNNTGYYYRRETSNSVTVRHRKSSNCEFELKAFQDSFKWARSSHVEEEYLSYMRIKQFTSYIYTSKLIPINHLQSYFRQCSKIIQQYPADFIDILKIARRKYLIEDFELLRHADLRSFIQTYRKSDINLVMPSSKKHQIPKSIFMAAGKDSKRVIYFPDWSRSNPYQKLLYQAISDIHATECLGLDVEDVCNENLSSLLKGRTGFIHLHWINPFLDSDKFTELKEMLLEAKERGDKVLWTIHNILSHESIDSQDEINKRRQLFQLSNHVLCHSFGAVRKIKDMYNVNTAKISVVRHGSYPVSSPMPGQFAEWATSNSLQLAILGDLRPYKNAEKAISLLERVNSTLPTQSQINLVIAGKPFSQEQSAFLKGQMSRHNWLKVYLNRLTEEEMNYLMTAMDFVFIPYKRIQSSGIAILALSNGTPFIAPAAGDLPEVGNKYCKILYQDDDDLASKLLELSRQYKGGQIMRMYPTDKILEFANSISWKNIVSDGAIKSILSSA